MPDRNSFLKICIALGVPDPARLVEFAEREAQAGESFFEFRLDYLDRPQEGSEAVRSFLRRYPEAMVLATCRRHQNHGKFNGSIEEQIHILESAVEAGAAAVDLEIESAEAATEKA